MKEYDEDELGKLLPRPACDAHKYSRGKAILFSGSSDYPGAACLAAHAAQRIGAGYTEVYAAPQSVSVIQAYRPSLVVRSWKTASKKAPQSFTEKNPCAYLVGTGMEGEDENTTRYTERLLSSAKAPVVLDGGALTVLTKKKIRRLCRSRFIEGLSTIITPHFGEAARLAAVFELPLDNQEQLAVKLSQAYGVTTMLKGSVTYISDGDDAYAMSEGTPALAKAGTGDVLAGLVSGLIAQSIDPFDACVLSSILHARAGNKAAEVLTTIAVTPEDIISFIPYCMQKMGT